jgi:hypothetical protein
MNLQPNKKNGVFSKLLPDIIAVVFLIAAGWKLLHGVETKLDLPLNDEVFYIYRGLIIPFTGWHNSDWGMLYSLWYWMLSFINSDPVALFYMNFKITAIIPPLLFFILLRKNKVQTATALLISWMLMISLGNLMTIPRVTHLGLFLIITPMFFINPEKKMLVSGWFLIIFLLIASYVRPEFMLAALLAFGFMGYHSLRKYKLYNPGLLIFGWLGVVLSFVTLAFFFELPWLQDESRRGFFALCQHFAYNYASWHPGTGNSWYLTPEIIHKVFGQADSYSDLISENPIMLLKHMGYNMLLFVQYIFGITFIHNRLILADHTRVQMYFEGLMLFLCFLGWIIWACLNNKDLVKRNFRSNRKLFLLFSFIGLPSVIGSIIIYPRWHYMIVVVYMLLAFISILIFSRNKRNRDLKSLFLAGFIIFMLTRTFSTAWYDTSDKIPQTGIRQEVKKVVLEIRKNIDTGRAAHFILDSQNGLAIYLMPEVNPVYDYRKTANLSNFLLGNRIDMVLIDGNFKQSVPYKMYKPEWEEFIKSPSRYGYKVKYINVPGYALFVQDSLLFK